MLVKESRKEQRLNVVVSETLITRVDEIVLVQGTSKSAFIRYAIEQEIERFEELALASAAAALAPAYENDAELTAFTALDGDDFIG